jgi:hypothetical protein
MQRVALRQGRTRMNHPYKRRFVVPVTFITAGTPAPLSDAEIAAQTFRRRWRAKAAFVDAFELSGLATAESDGVRLVPVTASAAAKGATWVWNDGTKWSLAEW